MEVGPFHFDFRGYNPSWQGRDVGVHKRQRVSLPRERADRKWDWAQDPPLDFTSSSEIPPPTGSADYPNNSATG